MTQLTNNFTLFETLDLVVTIPSIIGSLIMSYFCFKARPTNLTINMILAIGLSDLLFSCCNLLPLFDQQTTSTLCNIEGALRMFSATQSMFWSFTIATFHYKVISEGQDFNKGRFFRAAFAIGLLIGVGLCLR